ncbi:MAG TPA: ABC transporter substrate-binding protein, partial [Gaiellales bacterium]|nr:ABC transporter substrate-binding protein [Gaiellales bacterium]
MESGEQRLAGLWRCDGDFYALRLEAEPENGRPAAHLELTRTPLPYGLTVRELDVVTLIVGGLSNNEIGALLGSGGRTVGKHAERILAKLGQSTRAGVAALAVEEGLLRLPPPDGGGALRALPVGRVQAVVNGHARASSPAHRRALPRRPYLIGSAFPQGGQVAADGHEMIGGSALAVSEINARGGIGGRPVEQIVVDLDPLDPGSVTAAIESLIDREVDAITSGWLYAERAAVDAVADYGCPYLNAFTSEYVAELVREQQSRYASIFQVCATEAGYGEGFIRSLDTLAAAGAWRPPNRRLLFVEASVQSGHMATERTI